LKTGVHWTLRGTDHSECLQQTDNQPSNWKGSTPASSTLSLDNHLIIQERTRFGHNLFKTCLFFC
jgi:hypothetical protein